MSSLEQMSFLTSTSDSETINSVTEPSTNSPWAFHLRPKSWEDFHGQEHLEGWKSGRTPPTGLILWGPSGSGKTTLAFILAKQWNMELTSFNAVLNGVPELRKVIQNILTLKKSTPRKIYGLFIDEIHRFNRAQQDALLPYVEAGDFVLLGATTEKPQVSINRALLSRMQTLELKQLRPEEILSILKRAAKEKNLNTSDDMLSFLSQSCSGDARRALGNLQELATRDTLTEEEQKTFVLQQSRHYDRGSDRHYDVISAFIKSLRASDPNAALLYLAIMIDGGEDPIFIARRLVIFASEDVGNADTRALTLATSALTAIQNIGMPEARIILAQATTFLASTFKSNASYLGIDKALEFVKGQGTIEVPNYYKSSPAPGSTAYLYPHDFPNHWTGQVSTTLPVCPNFYRPKDIGGELALAQNLKKIDELKTSSP